MTSEGDYLHLNQGELNNKLRSFSYLGFHFDLTSVSFHNILAQRQADHTPKQV
jgi:hypothetical protein